MKRNPAFGFKSVREASRRYRRRTFEGGMAIALLAERMERGSMRTRLGALGVIGAVFMSLGCNGLSSTSGRHDLPASLQGGTGSFAPGATASGGTAPGATTPGATTPG